MHLIQRNTLYSLKLDQIAKLNMPKVLSNLQQNVTQIVLHIQQFPHPDSHLDMVYRRKLDRDLEHQNELSKKIMSRDANQD